MTPSIQGSAIRFTRQFLAIPIPIFIAVLNPELQRPLQTAWLIPLYGFIAMLVSLPWAIGLFRRQAHRPAAYLNILLTLLAFVHGSVILQHAYERCWPD